MTAQLEPLPEVARLSPAVVRILGGNPGKFTLQGTNTYLVGTGRRRLLVDTGEGQPSWGAALARVLAEDQATLAAALVTHWHPDHVGGVDQVRRLAPAAKVYQSHIDGAAALLGDTDAAAASRRTAGSEEDLDAPPPPPPTSSPGEILDIADGQTFAVEGATLRAVHTPGHTSNHMVFVLEQEGAVFAGDNVLGQGTAVFEDLAVYLQSLARMRSLYPKGGGRLYPGHGPVVDDGPAKITEYIEHRQLREDQVVRLLRAPPSVDSAASSSAASGLSAPSGSASSWTAMQLVEVIYADVRKDLHPAAERGLLQILKKLEGEGKVVQQGSAWSWRDRSPL